jgi:hypothetical protein
MSATEISERGADLAEDKRRSDEWLDQALAESFPASDPLPMFHGRAEPVDPKGPSGHCPEPASTRPFCLPAPCNQAT